MTLPPEEPAEPSSPGESGGRDPGRHRAPGSFSRSLAGAAARGTGLIAVAVAIGIVLLQYSDDPRPDQTAAGREPATATPLSPAPSTTTTVAGPRPPGDVRVLVLNASGRKGMAGDLSGRLRVGGYQTLEPGNAEVRPGTTVGCRPGFEQEATALASAIGVPSSAADPGTLLPPEADCLVIIGSA